MPDLLILTPDPELNGELERLGESQGFRARSCLQLAKAMDWLEVRTFDIVVVHVHVPLDQQQLLAGVLWKRNIEALFYVVDLEDRRSWQESRIFGAEVIKGSRALHFLGRALERFNAALPAPSSDFRVLVVEDLQSPRDIICIFIESLGYQAVRGVDSAKEALTLLQADPQEFACVVTDIKMPRMSGKELIETVRAQEDLRHLPIVVLTAFGTVDCLIDCLRAGASGFLVKPPKKADLSRELGRAKRIIAKGLDPCLLKEEEVEPFREILQTKGYVL